MPAGRKPKPANVHDLHGTYRADRHDKTLPKNAISSAKVLKTPPRDLSPKKKEHWKYFVKLLRTIGTDVAFQPDEEAMRLLVDLREDWVIACDELDDFGYYYSVTTKAGDIMRRANPAIAAKRTAETRLYAMLAEFGLTPSGRARLGADLSKSNDNPKDRFFNK